MPGRKVAGAAPEPQMSDTELARSALRAVAGDATAPPAARAQAARTLAEMAGALGRHALAPVTDTRPLTDLSAADLRAELARVRAGAAPMGGVSQVLPDEDTP